MKWINAEQQVTVTIYDEEHEEHIDRIMTVEEMLDKFTNEGCPTMYSNPERKTGKWIVSDDRCWHTCPFCDADIDVSMGTGVYVDNDEVNYVNYCPNCGARMEAEE